MRKSNKIEYPNEILKNLRFQNANRLVCAQVSISYFRNKFNLLIEIVNNNINVLMISETKLDASFPTGQFHIQSFSELYKLDKNNNGGGLHFSVYLKYLLIRYTYV